MNIKIIGNIPQYHSAGAAGFDIPVISVISQTQASEYLNASVQRANRGRSENDQVLAVVMPQESVVFGTGIRLGIPNGMAIDIKPRSGWLRLGLFCEGTIDSDYTGEICVIAWNISERDILVKHYDRIAQGLLRQAIRIDFEPVDSLDKTERGSNGFGSTGR